MNLKNLIPILLLPLIIYFFSFSLLIYNIDFYNYLFQTNNIKIENKDQITSDLFSYFQNNTFSKSDFSYFNEKENMHLLDVKIVLRKVLLLMETLLLIFILWIVFVSDYRTKIFFYGSLLTIFLTISFLIIPFDLLFDNFHFTFFSGLSWRFPDDSLLVNVYTNGFFQEFLFNICLISILISVLILILTLIQYISFTTIKFK